MNNAIPAWLPYLAIALAFAGFVLAPIAAVLMHRGQFFRLWNAPPRLYPRFIPEATVARGLVSRVVIYFTGWILSSGYNEILVQYVLPGEASSALANAGKMDGKANATISPVPWYEWRWAWLTFLLRRFGLSCLGPVWIVTVRYDPDRPEWSAELVAHELGAHLWPYLMGRGWNFDHGAGEEVEAVEARLLAVARWFDR